MKITLRGKRTIMRRGYRRKLKRKRKGEEIKEKIKRRAGCPF